MITLYLFQVLELHRKIIEQSGGTLGVRDFGALESALAQPLATFDKKDLYRSLPEKAAALAFSLSNNHPFIDGNKRIAHAATEIFLILNGYEIKASVDEQEQVFLKLASGDLTREKLANWIEKKIVPKPSIQ